MSVGPADPKSLQALPTWVVGAPIPPAVRIGKLLQGEYLINSILGEGELGVTYQAENARLKRKFAVLMLKRELKPTQGMMLQVRDDLRRAEPLQSVGVMPVKMIVDHMMIPGFATELLEGETLRARCSRGPLPPERALATVLAVARAMDALHKAGSVHGDLRPENIFLVRPGAKSSFAGRVMVVEHSLHALRRRSQGLDDQLPLYKLMYRPPECLAGERLPHIGGDVFVLGAILHESLTGRPAFYDEVADFVIDNLNQPPKPIPPNPAAGLTAELAATLSVLVASACARDPEVRTPDMAEIIVAIEQVVKGAGLVLPTVVTEEPQAAPAAPATPTASRMNRLLHRMSGVFPQVRLPPVTEPVASSPVVAAKASASLPRTGATTEVATPASVSIRQQATTMPPIAPPRTKVTMLLQKLSGVFPVLQVSPDGNLETLSSSDPKIAGPVALANQQAQAALSQSAVTAASTAVTRPALAAIVAPPAATPAGAAPVDAAKPVSPAAPGSDPAAPLAGPVSSVEPAPPAAITGAPAADKVTAAEPVAAPPKAAPAPAETAPAPGAAHPQTAPATPEPLVATPAPSGPVAAVPPATSAPIAEPPKSEVSKALALLRLQQQARATGQPVDLQKAGLGPATPESVVPAFMAPPPAAAPTTPSAPTSQSTPTNSGIAAITGAQRATAPPLVADPSGTQAVSPSVTATALAAAEAAADQGWLGLVSDTVTPAVSYPPSALSPTHERPKAGPPAAANIALASTLEPRGLAEMVHPAAASAGRRGPDTLSEIPTRPAAMAGIAPIPTFNEAKTQLALRSLPIPINEQATQAKLSPDLFNLATSIKSVAPDFSGSVPAAELATALKGVAPDFSRAAPVSELATAIKGAAPDFSGAAPVSELATAIKGAAPDFSGAAPVSELATAIKGAAPDFSGAAPVSELATAIKGAAPDFSGMLPAAALPRAAAPEALTMAVAAAPAALMPAAVAPVAPHPAYAAPTPAVGTPAPKFESLRELEAVSMIEDMPSLSGPVAADKSTPSRPPRVSQLIKALQNGQIDQFQALQQASGPSREPSSKSGGAAANVPLPAPPAASGSQPVVGPGSSSPSGPTPQGRVSPGLMALAPPPAANGDSPWGTASQQVVAPVPKVPAPVGLRGFLLRNQEVAAALIGALFVLLIGIAFLLFR